MIITDHTTASLPKRRHDLREAAARADRRAPVEQHERDRRHEHGDAREYHAGPLECEAVVHLCCEEREGGACEVACVGVCLLVGV